MANTGPVQIHDSLPINHWVTHEYQAKCSCGWLGPLRLNEEAAKFDLSDHRDDEMGAD